MQQRPLIVFNFPKDENELEEVQADSQVFYVKTKHTILQQDTLQFCLEELKLRDHTELLLPVKNKEEDQPFELIYFTAKTYRNKSSHIQKLLKSSFLILVRQYIVDRRFQQTGVEHYKAWTFLFCQLIIVLSENQPQLDQQDVDDELLREFLIFMKLDLYTQQFRESQTYIIDKVVKLIDLNKYTLSQNAKSITTIHILLWLYDTTGKELINNKLFQVIRTQSDCLEFVKLAIQDFRNNTNILTGVGILLKDTFRKIQDEKDVQTVKNLCGFMSLVQEKIPKKFALKSKELAALLNCENVAIRAHAIKMFGETLQFCVKHNKFQDDLQVIFKIVKARIFDKKSKCRMQALSQISDLGELMSKILNLSDLIEFYKILVDTVTDESSQVRSCALKVIEKLTKILFDQCYIGKQEIAETLINIFPKKLKIENKIRESFDQFKLGSNLKDDELKKTFYERVDVLEMAKDLQIVSDFIEKHYTGVTEQSQLEEQLPIAQANFIQLVLVVVEKLSALVAAATDSTNDILGVLKTLTYFRSAFPQEPLVSHAVSRALTLAFSSKPQIRNGIEKFFSETYFNKSQKNVHESIRQMAQLVMDAKVSDLVCIEEIMSRCSQDVQNKKMTDEMILELICDFQNNPQRITLYLIRLLKSENFDDHFRQIILRVRGMGQRSLELFPDICKFIDPKKCTAEQLDFLKNFVLGILLSDNLPVQNNLLWFQAMEQALNVLFMVPELSVDDLTKISLQLRDTIFQAAKDSISSAKTIFLAGHLSLKLLQVTERIKQEKESERPSTNELEQIISAPEAELDELERELEKFINLELIQNSPIQKVYICCQEFVQQVIHNYQASGQHYVMTLLERISVQALCKFMCVSQDICKKNLDIIMILVSQEYKVPTDVKQTVICAIGDLMRRFTNMIEDESTRIYSMLRDQNAVVRQSTLYMLSQLILTEAIKPKERIVDICVLLNDESILNRNLCENFLNELNSKNMNFIPQNFRQAFNRLSSKSFCDTITRDDFKVIAMTLMRFYTYVQDERSEKKFINLVQTLCKWCDTGSYDTIHRTNAVFCLTQINYFTGACREKTFLELFEFRTKLEDCRVHDQTGEIEVYLNDLCKKLNALHWRMTASSMSKVEKDEVEQKICDFKKQFEIEPKNVFSLSRKRSEKAESKLKKQNSKPDQLKQESTAFAPQVSNLMPKVQSPQLILNIQLPVQQIIPQFVKEEVSDDEIEFI